jgi:hypothetical protein
MVSLLAVLLAAAQALSGNRQIIVRIITVNGLRNCAVFFTRFLILCLNLFLVPWLCLGTQMLWLCLGNIQKSSKLN